jgi:hypothetical protein
MNESVETNLRGIMLLSMQNHPLEVLLALPLSAIAHYRFIVQSLAFLVAQAVLPSVPDLLLLTIGKCRERGGEMIQKFHSSLHPTGTVLHTMIHPKENVAMLALNFLGNSLSKRNDVMILEMARVH